MVILQRNVSTGFLDLKIIIVNEIDKKLSYATKDINFIELKTYEVDFQLNSFTRD
jgi:hypothetical protein